MGELQAAILHQGMKAVRRLPLVLWSLWIVFLVELLSRGGWGAALNWTVAAVPEAVLNAMVVLGFMLLLTAIIGSLRTSFWLIASICLAFGLISGVKLSILGVPFLPWDLLLTSETKDMAQYVSGLLNFNVISGLICFIAISMLLLYKLPRVTLRLRWKQRLIVAIGSALLLVSIYSDGTLSLKKAVHIQNIAWDQTQNVKTNGFLLTTLMNIRFLFLNEPDGYDEKVIKELASDVKPAVAVPGEIKPNIIVILSESFFDATKLKNIKFSKDPLPFFHTLMDNYTSGSMLSPQFGGGTANVEFEVLTGNSMAFLPQGSIPYNQYIDKGIDSLASILTRQGYTATSINPFHSWFYNSKYVYENFGFGQYIPQEFFEPDYEGPYIADRAVAKYIIETSEKTPGPKFIFANTMENHYHYYPGKFKENTIEVTGQTGNSAGLLETYAQGLLGADDMLKRLVSHFEKSPEPTIIAFFGDHLPSLGDDYQAYKDTGYLQENDPDFLNKMHRVPVLVWNNYLPKEQKEQLNMSTSFLGPYILKLAQRPGTYYTDFLYDLYQRVPVLPPKNEFSTLGPDAEKLKIYEKLQYDIMFGKQYGYADWKDKIKNPNYVLGLGKLNVQNVELETAEKEPKLKIKGSGIPHDGIVMINGQPVASTWINTNEVSAVLTPQLAAAAAGSTPLKVEIVVKDSKESVVVKSNEYVPSQVVFSGLRKENVK